MKKFYFKEFYFNVNSFNMYFTDEIKNFKMIFLRLSRKLIIVLLTKAEFTIKI